MIKVKLYSEDSGGVATFLRDVDVQTVPRPGDTFSTDMVTYETTAVTHDLDDGTINVIGEEVVFDAE